MRPVAMRHLLCFFNALRRNFWAAVCVYSSRNKKAMRIILLFTLCLLAAIGSHAQQVFTDAEIDSILNDSTFKHLSEVEIKAIRPLVKAEIDRLSYDVQADAESKTNTVLEMLRKVPLVTVDAEDNIRVKGATNFKIYKNGHPDPGIASNPKEVLKAIPASMIKRIEVITEPGAKYDAEGVGAILNIVMVENSAVRGVTGTVSAGIDNTGSPNANAYLTTQLGRWVTSLNYGMNHRNRHAQKSWVNRVQDYADGHRLTDESTTDDAHITVHYGNIESSFEADTLNLLTLSFGGYYYNYKANARQSMTATDAAGNVLYHYAEDISMPPSSYYNFNGRFDYEHKTRVKGEALTLSYMMSTSRDKSHRANSYHDMVNMPADYPGTSLHSKAKFWENTFQLDWTRPFARHNTVETGLKYIHRKNSSDTRFAYDATGLDPIVTVFDHLTQVGAAYASYTYRLDRWSARAGLRYEWSHLSGKYPDGSGNNFHTNLSDWVPSASVSFQPNMTHSLKLAFSSSISRPGINYLNPAIVDSPNSLSYGNSHLNSAHNYSLSLTYMFISPKVTFNVAPSYQFSNNGITEVRFAQDGKDVTTYGNVLSSRQWGLSGYVQCQMGDRTGLMLNGNAYHNSLRDNDRRLSNKQWSGFCYAQLTQQLPLKLRLTANIGQWTGGADNLYEKSGTSWWYGFGLQRSFLNEDRLTIRLNAQKPFSSRYNTWRGDFVNGDYSGYYRHHYPGRSFGLAVSYRFGSLRAQVKKTASTIDNSDVVGGGQSGGTQQGR